MSTPPDAAVHSVLQTRDCKLVIPARTAEQGSEREFLKGLEFEPGTGFAPHPLFARWVEEQIRENAAKLEVSGAPAATPFPASRDK